MLDGRMLEKDNVGNGNVGDGKGRGREEDNVR